MGSNRGRYIGDYRVCEQVGSGSFSVVWRATHRVNGSEFAIKEIHMQRLSRKLQESLLSEIAILRRINHPNIIRLHDSIETPGKIFLVLEYCSGGDLSMYIHDHGKVPEETAKHFMRQLAAGLNVLRENNIIHRDLKPQNLLLSSNDNQSVLKIADFGFARPLQPRDLAETLCGSPLYMAPEIMQLHKYDAKADLWSVGAILFQLVTGRTPFSGNNQDQLRQNIIKSNGIRFPPDSRDLSSGCMDLCQKLLRCNPVERLTFEEFFNHQFISGNLLGGSFRMRDDSIGSPARHTDDSSQEDCLPFHLDDDSSGPEANQSFQSRKPSAQTTPLGFPVHARIENPTTSNASVGTNVSSRNIKPSHVPDRIYPTHTSARPSDVMVQQSSRVTEPITMMGSSRVMDSLELIDQDYVLVSGPPVDFSSSTSSVSHAANLRCKSVGSPKRSMNRTPSSSPIPVSGMMIGNTCGSLGSSSSAPSAASLGSVDTGEFLEHPSTDSLTRIRSLQQCASAISEIVSEKIEGSKNMEAFSVQLVILAIWKQALHISHAQAASLAEPSRSQETVERKAPSGSSSQGKLSCSQIEKDFLLEVERAEELARDLGPGNTEMPDAMEIIFQSALVLGRVGGVDELMGNMDSAVSFYEKAIRIFFFLLVEAPSLILNPPFSLTNADRLRLRNYIEILNTRKCQSRSLRMALLSCGDQTSI